MSSLGRKWARKVFKRTGLETKHFEAWYLINYEKVDPSDLAEALAKRARQRAEQSRAGTRTR